MGRLKQLLPVGESTVVETVVRAVCEDVDQTLVIVGHQAAQIQAALRDLPVTCVTNPDYRCGMVTSVQAGMRQAPQACAYIVCLGDQPGVSRRTVGALVAAWRRAPAPLVVPLFGERSGHPIIVDAALRNQVLALGADQGLNQVTGKYRDRRLLVRVQDDEILQDMDTVEDYAAYLQRIRRAKGDD
jgi:molybdenum cofactor cytidylyltransferase